MNLPNQLEDGHSSWGDSSTSLTNMHGTSKRETGQRRKPILVLGPNGAGFGARATKVEEPYRLSQLGTPGS